MTMMDIEVIDLTSHEFELECEFNDHEIYGRGKVIAVVYFELPCCGFKYDKHCCEGCLVDTINDITEGWDDPDLDGCGGTWPVFNQCVKDVHYL